jgi:hypothetical protein
MATIEIKDKALHVNIEGLDKILALRSSITVPLSHIRSVAARPDISKLMYMSVTAKFRGVNTPGHLLAGTLVMADGSGDVFCDVRDGENAIAIELHHEQYKRLILEVSGHTPEAARDLILAASGAPRVGGLVEAEANPGEPRHGPAGNTR